MRHPLFDATEIRILKTYEGKYPIKDDRLHFKDLGACDRFSMIPLFTQLLELISELFARRQACNFLQLLFEQLL